MDNIFVKRQMPLVPECWGVYNGNYLIKGGITDKSAALQHADDWRSEIAAEQSVYDSMMEFEERFVASMMR